MDTSVRSNVSVRRRTKPTVRTVINASVTFHPLFRECYAFLLSAGKGKKKAVPVEQMQDDTAIVIQNRIILSVIKCGRGMGFFFGVMKSLSFFDCQKEKGTNDAVIQLLNEVVYG